MRGRAAGLLLAAWVLGGALGHSAEVVSTVKPRQLATQATKLGGGPVGDPSFVGGPAIRIPARADGSALALPGTLPWADTRFLTVDALVDGEHTGEVVFRFFAAGETEARVTVSLGLFPGLRTRLSVPLSALDARELTLPRTPGRFFGRVRGRRLAPGDVGRVGIHLEETAGPQQLYLGVITLATEEPSFPVPRQRLADELGQWVSKEWEGKTTSDAFLGTWLTVALEKDVGATYPKAWCERGGTTATTFKATGFFRTHNDGKRWWLVDPEGHGFYSLGLDGVRPGEVGVIVPGTEPLLGPLPSERGPLGLAFQAPGSSGLEGYSFGLANLIRSFGPAWRDDWTAMTHSRLLAWRFNTIGSGSDPRFQREVGLPWVLEMPPYPTTETLLYRDMPDVYSEEFREATRRWARHLAAFGDDPGLVGYFMANEPKWAFGASNLAAEMLEAHPGTETRKALAHWLRTRYKNDAADWSVAWGLGLTSFDDVLDQIVPGAADRSETAKQDLWDFSKEMVRAWAGIPGLACNEVDSNHLNLGMRYASLSSELLYEAVGVFDVFSISADGMEAPLEQIAEISARTRRPVLLGRFHFGALDRGLPSAGRRVVASQRERGIAYRRYVETAAAHPDVVGTHYSGLNDQELLGDVDGENDQIGFIDVCHRPYPEIVESATRSHEAIYDLLTGGVTPFRGKAREMAVAPNTP